MKKSSKKSNTFIFSLIILGIVILAGFTIYKLYNINERNKQEIPYLIKGEKIKYFDLTDGDAKQISASVLKTSHRPVLIFIFSRPCSPCDKNIVYWRQMHNILGDRVDFYGIVLNSATVALNLIEETKLNFKIYIPSDLEKFINMMRLKLNLSQTILYSHNQVVYLKLGELEGDEAAQIINVTKKLI